MNKEERGIEINLFELLRKLVDNLKYIIIVTCIFGILGLVYSSLFITPIYQAGAKMMVNSRNDESQNITNDQYNASKNLVGTYAVIIRSRDVLNQVKEELNLQETYAELADSITVSSVNSTPVMQINVQHPNRDTALQITEKLLEIAPVVLVETTAAGSVKPVEGAYAGYSPVSPNVFKNTVLTAFIGFALTCLVIFVFMLTDNTYKTDLDIQKDLNLPVLGVIPEFDSCRGHSTRKKVQKKERAV